MTGGTAEVGVTLRQITSGLSELSFDALNKTTAALRQRKSETTILLSLLVIFVLSARQRRSYASRKGQSEPQGREKELLASGSDFRQYHTAFGLYPSIRTLVLGRDKLATEKDGQQIPILVFVHGLGGSLMQFEPLIRSLHKSVPCFGIDFPGCGLSRFDPACWNAYSQQALADLVRAAFMETFPGSSRPVIMVGHSMGCRVAQTFARHSPRVAVSVEGREWPKVLGLVAICPEDKTYTWSQELAIGTFLTLPNQVFNLFRLADRKGGIDSMSVHRFAGKSADQHTRELQLQFSEQSQTPVFRRMAWGTVRGSIEGAESWTKQDPSIPLLLIAGEQDTICPPATIQRIEAAVKSITPSRKVIVKVLRGSHALPYDSHARHGVTALIENFIEDIDHRLSRGHQLQHEKGNKWDVKNLTKWLTVMPVSPAIGKPKPIFRAMKTLRGVDEVHNPERFAQDWEKEIKAVIDISQDVPTYDPGLFRPRSVEYVKFATTSKIPPTKDQVLHFNELVDELRDKEIPGWMGDPDSGRDRAIGVHCHYGFNRTGFFICAYLITRCGYSIEEALEEFRNAKPPGIKHEHFVDQLYLRYESRDLSQ